MLSPRRRIIEKYSEKLTLTRSVEIGEEAREAGPWHLTKCKL
ncbi:MAG: hypothetical protein ACP5II_04325 [Infirmifilum sp.]